MASDRYKYFRVEARELVDQLGKGLLDIEKGAPAAEQIQRLLRHAHTLKGAARIVKQPRIAELAHEIEDVLVPFRNESGRVARSTIDAALRIVDQIDEHVAALTPAGVQVPAQTILSDQEQHRSIHTDTADMDKLFDSITAAHIQLASLRREFAALERAGHLADLLLDQFKTPLRPAGHRTHEGERTRSITDELRGAISSIERRSSTEMGRLESELTSLRETAEQLRLVPAKSIFTSLERTARDTAQATQKLIRFECFGGELRLEAKILAGLQGALLQIVRNAVAHGIEPEKERRLSGKPLEGLIQLRITRTGPRAIFSCTDDGRGVDLAAVRTALQRQGSVPETTEGLEDEAVVRHLLKGGVSTAGNVTGVSGRGIGMDVVRESAEQLGGEVNIQTKRGIGTTVEIAVPLSLTSMDVLQVETAGMLLAIPLEHVRQTSYMSAGAGKEAREPDSMFVDGAAIPFVLLHRLLNARVPPRQSWSVVVLQGKSGLSAFGVEYLRGIIRTVLRPLPDLAPGLAYIAGAILDGEGNPRLVLDTDELLEAATRTTFTAQPEAARRLAPILIIDDSLTTRMLEQSILESAGYSVEVASSAEEGIEMAQRTGYALFLVDVEMPGMDGFEFIKRSRENPLTRHIPAIMVSSRAAAEDKKRGFDAGAKGYMVKSEFDQAELLNRIRDLIA